MCPKLRSLLASRSLTRNVAQQTVVDFDISDFDKEPSCLVPTSPAMRRSSRIQTQDSPWAQWPSEKIIAALGAVSIPFNCEMPRKALLFLTL